MTDFFQTVMGRRFYESTVPHLVQQLARIADSLEAQQSGKDTAAVDAIVKLLDGKALDNDSWSDIATVLEQAGRKVRAP